MRRNWKLLEEGCCPFCGEVLLFSSGYVFCPNNEEFKETESNFQMMVAKRGPSIKKEDGIEAGKRECFSNLHRALMKGTITETEFNTKVKERGLEKFLEIQ